MCEGFRERIIFVKIVDHFCKFKNMMVLKRTFILLKSLLLFLFISFSHLTKVLRDSFDYE